MKITYINLGGDNPALIYVDGKYLREGDYYHDKISEWTNGFVQGLWHAGIGATIEHKYLEGLTGSMIDAEGYRNSTEAPSTLEEFYSTHILSQ